MKKTNIFIVALSAIFFISTFQISNAQTCSTVMGVDAFGVLPPTVSPISPVSIGGPGSTDYGVFVCLLYTSPSPRDATLSRMPSSA